MNEKLLKSCLKNDLTLLVPLYALLHEKHVTRAAHRIDVSQSSMSHYLSRIRSEFNDDILVRQGNKMLLTPVAEQMLPALETIMESIKALHNLGDFNPEDNKVKFTLSVNDVFGIATKALLNWAQNQNPPVQLSIKTRNEHIYNDLEDGHIDFIVGNLIDAPDYLYSRKIGQVHYQLFDSKEKPLLDSNQHDAKGVSEHAFAVLSGNGKAEQRADELFSNNSLKRKVSFEAHSLSGIVDAVKYQDLLAFLPSIYSLEDGLYAVDCDLNYGVNINLYWHPKMHSDAAHIWIRNNIYQLVKSAFFNDLKSFNIHR